MVFSIQTMFIIFLIGILLLVWLYIAAKLISRGAARSWFEFNQQHKEVPTTRKRKVTRKKDEQRSNEEIVNKEKA